MARVHKLHLKDLKTTKSSSSAFRQLLVLVLTVIMGMLISVSCNAQTTSERKPKASEKKKLPYKTRNRARANHYAVQTEPAVLEKTVLLTNILEKQIISEMVAQNLKEHEGNEIELAPLMFDIRNGRLTAVDVNPLLIAIEFGLQGKKILVQSFGPASLPAHQQLTYGKVLEVVTLMNEMGVPEERLEVVACNSAGKDSDNVRIDFTAL